MRAELIGELVNGALTSFVGIYLTLLASRMVGPKPGANLRFDHWHQRFGGMCKVLGPGLVLLGVFLGSTGVARMYRQRSDELRADWKRYNTSDGVCSAEFPQPPNEETTEAMGIVSNKLVLSLSRNDTYYSLSFSDIPPDTPFDTEQDGLDAARDSIPVLGEQMGLKYEFVREERITENDVPGRSLEYRVGPVHIFCTKVFIRGSRIYRLIAVTPRSKSPDESTQRFLSSLRFES